MYSNHLAIKALEPEENYVSADQAAKFLEDFKTSVYEKQNETSSGVGIPLKVKISKVTRGGKIKIKFNQEMNVPSFDSISNSSSRKLSMSRMNV